MNAHLKTILTMLGMGALTAGCALWPPLIVGVLGVVFLVFVYWITYLTYEGVLGGPVVVAVPPVKPLR